MAIALPLLLLLLPSPPGESVASAVADTIRGQVVDDTQEPVAGATVTLEDRGARRIRVVVTDATGHFEVAVTDVGRYSVRVQHPKYRTIALPPEVAANRADVAITLPER